MTFGQKLKTLREAAGMTQAGLSTASGVPLGTIRDYEQVKRDPLLPTANRLASALGVSIAEFAECVDKSAVQDAESREEGEQPHPRKAHGKAKRSAGEGKANRKGETPKGK
jgi:transcriptional regulator with XRE-family HTH domain